MIVTAQYKINSYQIHIIDGSNEMITASVFYETDLSLYQEALVPHKEGYLFIGWEETLPETMPSNDIYLHPIWGELPI